MKWGHPSNYSWPLLDLICCPHSLAPLTSTLDLGTCVLVFGPLGWITCHLRPHTRALLLSCPSIILTHPHPPHLNRAPIRHTHNTMGKKVRQPHRLSPTHPPTHHCLSHGLASGLFCPNVPQVWLPVYNYLPISNPLSSPSECHPSTLFLLLLSTEIPIRCTLPHTHRHTLTATPSSPLPVVRRPWRSRRGLSRSRSSHCR